MKVHRFRLSGGESVTLNDAQLYALHHMPAQYVSWPTYWALRRRKLITGPQHYIRSDLTERGKEALRFAQFSTVMSGIVLKNAKSNEDNQP